jgi:hypothetical protein
MHLMKGVNNLVDARQELARVERELAGLPDGVTDGARRRVDGK